MAGPARVVGLGGSLRAASTSRTALQAALEGAAGAGADTRLISVRDLDLPLCTAERDPPYLSNKPIGLVTTAGGIQGLQAINSMDFMRVRCAAGAFRWCRRCRRPGGRSTRTGS